MLCWRGLAPPQAAPLCSSTTIQGRNGAADFPTENWSSIVWLCQNTFLPIMTNAPSESQQHKMVVFPPLKCCASHAGWIQSLKLRSGKYFFLCSLIWKSRFGCTVYLPTRHELLSSLLFYFSTIKCWRWLIFCLFFLMLPQIRCLKTSPLPCRTPKKPKISTASLEYSPTLLLMVLLQVILGIF